MLVKRLNQHKCVSCDTSGRLPVTEAATERFKGRKWVADVRAYFIKLKYMVKRLPMMRRISTVKSISLVR